MAAGVSSIQTTATVSILGLSSPGALRVLQPIISIFHALNEITVAARVPRASPT
jgi:hypothetical protein